MTAEALIVIVAGNRCAVPMERVIEVRVHVGATRIPGAPEWVCGIVEREGAPVEVFDAARRFGLQAVLTERDCVVFFDDAAMLVEDVDGLIARRPAIGECFVSGDLVAETIDDDGTPMPMIDVDAFFGASKEHA
jgi:chemotaxis signal transduction protein